MSDPSIENWREYDSDYGLTEVLEGALQAFVKHGYHGTKVREIADNAGLSVPGLYYHAPSKQSLLADLLRFSIEEVLARSRKALDSVGKDPVERFVVQVENIVLYMTHRQRLALLAREISNLEDEGRRHYVALRDQQEQMIVKEVKAGNKAGVFRVRYPDDATRAVTTMCRAVSTWYSPGGSLSPDELANRYVEFSLSLVGHADSKS